MGIMVAVTGIMKAGTTEVVVGTGTTDMVRPMAITDRLQCITQRRPPLSLPRAASASPRNHTQSVSMKMETL